MKEIILIDAFSQIFRCFYAVRALTNSKGEPTNAVLPFVRILLKLHREYPDNPGALVFDCGRVNFRMKLNPEYKATRPPMPEALKVQIPVIREFAAAFGWPLHEEPEYEADDLIAAIALNSSEEFRIISSDKDLSQLICDRIYMMLPDSKNYSWEFRDPEAVKAKFNVTPEQIIDYLALLGDSADNIPGVPGIGTKTAATLLQTCGSVDAMLANPEIISNARQRQLIVDNQEILNRNRELIKLRSDLPERFRNTARICRRTQPDWKRITELCQRWELRSILKELPRPEPEKEPEQGDLFGDF